MSTTKFSVIIPTRERADTLYWSIKTCITQDYSNLEILVSDNYSQDNTREVVESFDDSRIRYINPEKRLGMSNHWDFALSHATGDYIMIIGDDDGLLPNACEQVNTILKTFKTDVVCSPFLAYIWPTNVASDNFSNILTFFRFNESGLLDAKENLSKVSLKGYEHSILPMIYWSFVSSALINRIKLKTGGSFFHAVCPDIYSGVIISNHITSFYRSKTPFVLPGSSHNSNGASQSSLDMSKKAEINKFWAENTIKMHHKLLDVPSSNIYAADALYRAYDLGLLDRQFLPSISIVLKNAMKSASYQKSKAVYNRTKVGVIAIAQINGVPEVEKYMSYSFLKPIIEIIKKATKKVYIVLDNHKIKNIYDASLQAANYFDKKPTFIENLVSTLKIQLKNK